MKFMNHTNLCILIVILSLSGCDQRKSSQEVIADLRNLHQQYRDCSSGKVDYKTKFCEYVKQEPADMQDNIRMVVEAPVRLGEKILLLQGQIVALTNDQDKQAILAAKERQLQRCYLVIKLVSALS